MEIDRDQLKNAILEMLDRLELAQLHLMAYREVCEHLNGGVEKAESCLVSPKASQIKTGFEMAREAACNHLDQDAWKQALECIREHLSKELAPGDQKA